jgi:hypothetical protein
VSALLSRAGRGVLLLVCAFFVATLLPSCLPKSPKEQAATAAVAELRSLEVYTHIGLPDTQYAERLAESRNRLEKNLVGVDSLVAMEMRRAFAFYDLSRAPRMARIVGRPNITAEELCKLGKEQTDFAEKFAAASLPQRQKLLLERPILMDDSSVSPRDRRPASGYVNPLSGRIEPIFERNRSGSTPPPVPTTGGPTPWRPLTRATPVPTPPPVVLLQTYEARTQYGSVKLPAGTRLNVIAQSGETITVQYGPDRLSIPKNLTRVAR